MAEVVYPALMRFGCKQNSVMCLEGWRGGRLEAVYPALQGITDFENKLI
jgi:hypothetical protein